MSEFLKSFNGSLLCRDVELSNCFYHPRMGQKVSCQRCQRPICYDDVNKIDEETDPNIDQILSLCPICHLDVVKIIHYPYSKDYRRIFWILFGFIAPFIGIELLKGTTNSIVTGQFTAVGFIEIITEITIVFVAIMTIIAAPLYATLFIIMGLITYGRGISPLFEVTVINAIYQYNTFRTTIDNPDFMDEYTRNQENIRCWQCRNDLRGQIVCQRCFEEISE